MAAKSSSSLSQLIYISSARFLLSDQELLELLCQARDFNAAHDISGILVYNDGVFIQVLEGHASTISNLYQRIQRDQRHHRCITLLHQHIAQRAFEGWVMGFPVSSPAIEVESIDGYIDFFNDCPVPSRGLPAYRILASFHKQHDRKFHYAA